MVAAQGDSAAVEQGAQMRKEWMAELKRLQARLEQNERYFNMICDFDMTEANILSATRCRCATGIISTKSVNMTGRIVRRNAKARR